MAGDLTLGWINIGVVVSYAVPMIIMHRVLSTGCDMIVGGPPVHMSPGSGRRAVS